MDDFPRQPVTRAVFLALRDAHDPRARSDLLFLEAWEIDRPSNLGEALRAHQLRRANPDLVEAIERELTDANTPGNRTHTTTTRNSLTEYT
jgi:hypothetical protein